MRLTSRGKEYIISIVLLVVIGVPSGEPIFEAAALSMAVAALFSILILRIRQSKAVKAVAEEKSLRVFKNSDAHIRIVVTGLADRWVSVKVESAAFNGPVRVASTPAAKDTLDVFLVPTAAGRFTGLHLSLGLTDALRLYERSTIETPVEITLDSLPDSLLLPVRKPIVSPLALGERPSGTAGRGQEFYGIAEYSYRSESKDIMWKRAAKAPDKPLLTKVRESNIPESVRVFVLFGDVSGLNISSSVDLLCEALGSLGRSLLRVGTDLVLVGPERRIHLVRSEEELADAIMSISAEERSGATSVVDGSGDIAILVGSFAGDWPVRGVRTPSVLIGGSPLPRRNNFAFDYVLGDDLSGVVGLVLAA